MINFAILDRHIRRLEARLAELARLDHGFTLAAFLWGPDPLKPVVLAAAVLVFAGVVFCHRRVDRARLRFRLALTYACTQRARLALDWEAIPQPPAVPVPAGHPFAADLNLTGSRSLHTLLDTAASSGGSRRLGEWLLNPTPDLAAIQSRQALLQELIPLSSFRRRLAMNGLLVQAQVKGHWSGEQLLDWLSVQALPASFRPLLAVLFVLAGINAVLFALNALAGLPAWWTIGLAVYAGLYLYQYRRFADLFENAYTLSRSLEQFRQVLVYLEAYPYPAGGRLAGLCAPFFSQPGRRPSAFLRQIVWITAAAGLGDNQLWALLINVLLPWNLLFAWLLSRYQAALHQSLPAWLDTWYELEALNSLANFAYLNPGYVFPEIAARLPGNGRAVFSAQALGHPLIPAGEKVCNDFALDAPGEVALITGSNMAGKSTFLRTLGINLCLAYAGGPVNAARLHTGLFRLFTCIQVSDSLADGISYFYAEVRRLRALLDALAVAHPYPLFFLIDELFRGTNNQERRSGSQAYIRTLVHSQGLGAISTHDLELAHLAEGEVRIHNFHFREEVHAGRMVFDYYLRPGPCPTTNALKIMALEGLPVAD